jgi:uncharacterized membrane protein
MLIAGLVAHLCDLVIAALLAIWLAGGIPWNGRVLLHHGADPRRAAILLGIALSLFPVLRIRSWALAGARWVWEGLASSRRARWFVLGCACIWAAALGVLQAYALRYPLYDVGIFQQILWNLAHGHGFGSTLSGTGNFLLDHFSPSLVLLTPFYWVTASWPAILPLLQALLIFGGVAAWLWLAESLPDLELQGRLAAGVLVFALGFDSLWGNLRWGFHETSIAFAALSWAFALLFGAQPRLRNGVLIFLLFVVSAGSKEILLLDTAAAFGIWAWRDRDRPLASTWLLLCGFAVAGVFVSFERASAPLKKNYFERYYAYLGGDIGAFAHTLFLEPGRVLDAIGAKEILLYLKNVFLPFLALPLAWISWDRSRALWLVAIIPSFASAFLSTVGWLRIPSYHYVLELWPVLACLTILALARLKSRGWIIAWALLSLILLDQDPWNQMREYARDAFRASELRARIASVPGDVSVSADELAGPWIANRESVSRWPDLSLFPNGCPDWVILKGDEAVAAVQASSPIAPCLRGAAPQIEWSEGDWIAYRLKSP